MNTKTIPRQWPVLVSFFIFVVTPAMATSQIIVGRIGSIEGRIIVARTVGSSLKQITAYKGLELIEHDELTSGEGSQAMVHLTGDHTIKLGPKSFYRISRHFHREDTETTQSLTKLIYGQIRASVRKLGENKKSSFQVHTPNAVLGVRGTEFTASFDPASQVSSVQTESGAVGVQGARFGDSIEPLQVSEEIIVQEGEKTSVEGKGNAQVLPTVADSTPIDETESDPTGKRKIPRKFKSLAEEDGTKQIIWELGGATTLNYADRFDPNNKNISYKHMMLTGVFTRISRTANSPWGFGLTGTVGGYSFNRKSMRLIMSIGPHFRFYLPKGFFVSAVPALHLMGKDAPYMWTALSLTIGGGWAWQFKNGVSVGAEISAFMAHFHSVRDLFRSTTREVRPFFNTGGPQFMAFVSL